MRRNDGVRPVRGGGGWCGVVLGGGVVGRRNEVW